MSQLIPESAGDASVDAAPPSPFARLRVRGLVIQIVLVIATVLLAAHVAFPWLRRSEHAATNMLLAYPAMVVVLAIRARYAGLSWRRLLGPPPRLNDLPLLGIVVPLGLITAAMLILLFVPMSYVAPELVQRTILDESPLERITSVRQFVILFLTIAIVAPIVEELVFRGFFLQRFAHKWGTATGVVASSALFAVGHVEWVGHFVTGVAFALIYLRTRSLWMAMLSHAVYNAMFAASIGWNFFTHARADVTTMAEFRDSLSGGAMAFFAGVLLLWMYLDLYWKERTVGEVLEGPVPYASQGAPSGSAPG